MGCFLSRSEDGETGGVNKGHLFSLCQATATLLDGQQGHWGPEVKRLFGENWKPDGKSALIQHSKEWRLNEENGEIKCYGEPDDLARLHKALVALWGISPGSHGPPQMQSPANEFAITRETFDLLLRLAPWPLPKKETLPQLGGGGEGGGGEGGGDGGCKGDGGGDGGCSRGLPHQVGLLRANRQSTVW